MKKRIATVMILLITGISYLMGKAEGRKQNENIVEIHVPYEGSFNVSNVKAIAMSENGLTFALTNDGKIMVLTHSSPITSEDAQKMKALYEKCESK